MDWDVESENLKLENMIILYQEHIDILEKENKNLKNQAQKVWVDILKCGKLKEVVTLLTF